MPSRVFDVAVVGAGPAGAATALYAARHGLGVALIDHDQDGWPDIFVANDTQPNKLYRNLRNGKFRDVGLEAGVALSVDGKARAGMGVDVAYLDGTFYDAGELPGRDMSEIPHPFIQETLQRLAALPAEQRAKVRFIHLNHTNPALVPGGAARQAIEAAGMHVAAELERSPL